MDRIPYCDTSNGQASVRVDLQHSADVYLIDESNLRKRQNGQQFRFFGGHYTKTPVIISAHGANRWYLIVDNGSGEQYSYQWL